MTAETDQTERDPVADAARSAFTRADGDVAQATRLMEQAVRSDRVLRDEITEPLISGACYAAVRAQCRGARRTVWHTSRRELEHRHAEGARRAVAHAETLLAFPLLGGRHLGDAQRAEIEAAAEFFTRQAGDMAAKGRWLRLVAEALPHGRTVAQTMDEMALRRLQAEARRHA